MKKIFFFTNTFFSETFFATESFVMNTRANTMMFVLIFCSPIFFSLSTTHSHIPPPPHPPPFNHILSSGWTWHWRKRGRERERGRKGEKERWYRGKTHLRDKKERKKERNAVYLHCVPFRLCVYSNIGSGSPLSFIQSSKKERTSFCLRSHFSCNFSNSISNTSQNEQ